MEKSNQQYKQVKVSENDIKMVLQKLSEIEFSNFTNSNLTQGRPPIEKFNQQLRLTMKKKQSTSDQAIEKLKEKEDSRKIVFDCSQYPYSSIGYLEMEYIDYRAWGTAFLIGPNIALTSADNVYDKVAKIQAKQISFTPAMSIKNPDKIKIKVKNVYFPEMYKNKTKVDCRFHNYCLIQLDCNYSLCWKYGYLGIMQNWESFEDTIHNSSYPCDLNNQINTSWQIKSQFEQSGKVEFCKPQTDGSLMELNIKGAAGQNGSPIFIKRNQKFYVVGIQVENHNPNKNLALKIDKTIKKQINTWLIQKIPRFTIDWKVVNSNPYTVAQDYCQRLITIQIGNTDLVLLWTTICKLKWKVLTQINFQQSLISVILPIKAECLKKLDLNESKITKIQNLDHLSNLLRLSLFQNKIKKIENLSKLKLLRFLNLGQNLITQIQNLDQLTSLRSLHLDTNQITKMQNLEKLMSLQGLYLQYNKIKTIQNISTLKRLKSLWLQRNQISVIQDIEVLSNLKQIYLWNNQCQKTESFLKIRNILAEKGVTF